MTLKQCQKIWTLDIALEMDYVGCLPEAPAWSPCHMGMGTQSVPSVLFFFHFHNEGGFPVPQH